jgi:hypothetical protein
MLHVFTADTRRLDAALAGLKETVGSVTPPGADGLTRFLPQRSDDLIFAKFI